MPLEKRFPSLCFLYTILLQHITHHQSLSLTCQFFDHLRDIYQSGPAYVSEIVLLILQLLIGNSIVSSASVESDPVLSFISESGFKDVLTDSVVSLSLPQYIRFRCCEIIFCSSLFSSRLHEVEKQANCFIILFKVISKKRENIQIAISILQYLTLSFLRLNFSL